MQRNVPPVRPARHEIHSALVGALNTLERMPVLHGSGQVPPVFCAYSQLRHVLIRYHEVPVLTFAGDLYRISRMRAMAPALANLAVPVNETS
jgi:hypothetical protein